MLRYGTIIMKMDYIVVGLCYKKQVVIQEDKTFQKLYKCKTQFYYP